METIRINELARELEVKSKAVLDYLPEIGVTDKKSHSSALDEETTAKVRAHFRELSQEAVGEEEAKQAPGPAASLPPGVHIPSAVEAGRGAELRAEPHPIRRSLEEIKAEARRAVATPVPPRPAPIIEKTVERRSDLPPTVSVAAHAAPGTARAPGVAPA